jgi:hypothetical protein
LVLVLAHTQFAAVPKQSAAKQKTTGGSQQRSTAHTTLVHVCVRHSFANQKFSALNNCNTVQRTESQLSVASTSHPQVPGQGSLLAAALQPHQATGQGQQPRLLLRLAALLQRHCAALPGWHHAKGCLQIEACMLQDTLYQFSAAEKEERVICQESNTGYMFVHLPVGLTTGLITVEPSS